MAPRRKTRSMTGGHRQPDSLEQSSSKSLRKKVIRDDSNVEEWVYRFLGNLAAIERDKEETKRRNMTFKSTTDRGQSLKAARLHLRSPTPYAWSPLRHPVDSDGDEMEEEEDDDALITPMSHARTRVARALSIDGPHVGKRDPTLLQKINRYIRAGIAEGKRRAKRYVRKALSFAIETGYITTVDREGKLLRVSPALLATGGKPLVDARGSRRPPRRSGRGRSGRAAGGRVRRRGTSKRKTTRARRRRTNEGGSGIRNKGGDMPDSVTAGNAKRRRNEGEMRTTTTVNETASRELADKSSGGSRKSSARPSSSSGSPSRRSHQRPMEDSTPTMPGIGSADAGDRKPLSARSRASSFARRSRDDDLMA